MTSNWSLGTMRLPRIPFLDAPKASIPPHQAPKTPKPEPNASQRIAGSQNKQQPPHIPPRRSSLSRTNKLTVPQGASKPAVVTWYTLTNSVEFLDEFLAALEPFEPVEKDADENSGAEEKVFPDEEGIELVCEAYAAELAVSDVADRLVSLGYSGVTEQGVKAMVEWYGLDKWWSRTRPDDLAKTWNRNKKVRGVSFALPPRRDTL